MTTYTFQVREVTSHGVISWEVEEVSTKTRFPLPQGGTGRLLGQYPEIEEYLKQTYQKQFELLHIPTRDKLNLDYKKSDYVWEYHRKRDIVVVHDIPRTVIRLKMTYTS